MKKILGLTLAALATVGCSSTPTFETGPDAEVTFDGLTRMQGTTLQRVWARTDIDLTEYSKIMFQGIGVEFRTESGPMSGRAGLGTSSASTRNVDEFMLDQETRDLVVQELRTVFLDEMGNSDAFEIVEEPGYDVLLVGVGLLDVVSRVPPETTGRSTVWLDSVGEATIVLEVRDSVSNSIFARAADRRAASAPSGNISNRVTNAAELRRLGRQWATIVRNGLDSLLTTGLETA